MLMCREKMTASKSEKIIEIAEGNRVFYGGNQEWFENDKLKKVGCSIVAASNLIAYKALKNNDDKLFNFKDRSKGNFLKLMNSVFEYLVPDEKIGIISSLYFIDRMESYFKDKGVKVNPKWITTEYKYEEFENFIYREIGEDKPILLMLLKNVKLKDIDWHWMTITRIFKCNDIIYVNVSTWGEKRVVRLYDVYIYSCYASVISF
mgnify:CR=1 FL=1